MHERDPDIDDDPDIAHDKDLSLNYKKVASDVLARYKRALVFPTDNARDTYLKEHPEADPTKHTVNESATPPHKGEVEPKEPAAPKTEEKPHDDKAEAEAALAADGHALMDLGKANQALGSTLKAFGDPKSDLGGLARANPAMKVQQFLPSKDIILPPGIHTIGDVVKALGQAKLTPRKKKPGAPKSEQHEEAPEAPKPPEVPKSEGKPEEKAKEEKPTPGTPTWQPPIPNTPEEKAKNDEISETVKSLAGQSTKPSPEFKEFAEGNPTGKTDAEGRLLFKNPNAKNPGERLVSFDKLSPQEQWKVGTEYKTWASTRENADKLGTKLDDKGKALIRQLNDPSSEVAKKVQTLVAKHGEDVTLQRALPELGEVEGVETVKDLKNLIAARPQAFADRETSEKWVSSGGAKSKAFRAYAEITDGFKVDKEGNISVLDPKGKEYVPFDQLDKSAQKKAFQRFEKEGPITTLKAAQEKSPELKRALQDLSNPASEMSQRLAEGQSGSSIEDALPELKDHVPEGISTVGELTKLAKKLNPPLPAPRRREASPEETKRAVARLMTHLPKDADRATLDTFASIAAMHPDDINRAATVYALGRKAKLPDDLSKIVKGAQQVYVTDSSQIRPPAYVEGPDGKKREWDTLEPQEQADAMEAHKAEVLGTSLALREHVESGLHKAGVPIDLAPLLSKALLRPKGNTPEEKAKWADKRATKMFTTVIGRGRPDSKISDERARKILKGLRKEPAARRIAVGYLQAHDYHDALDEFFGGSERQLTEHSTVSDIASGLIRASDRLRKRQKMYGSDAVQDTGTIFRERVIEKLGLLDPDKAEPLREALKSYEAEDYERRKKEHEKALSAWEKTKQGPYRTLPPPEPPAPPPGYGIEDEPRSGKGLLDEQLRKMGFPKLASKVLDRWRHGFSSYPGHLAMASTPPMSRTALYHGVDPYGYGVEPYTKWTQIHQRDLGEADYRGLLAAAREWMRTSVLSKAIDGIVPDTQFRAALDLAVKTHEGGRYDASLHPSVYNMLLAKLAGEPQNETLLTVRQASVRTAGVSYALDRASYLFIQGRKPVPFNVDTIREINSTFVNFVDDDGEMHAIDDDGGASIKVLHFESDRRPLTFNDEKQGLRHETRVDVAFPAGSGADVRSALMTLGKKHGFIVEPTTHTYQPSVRKTASGDTMTMPKFAAQDANNILGRLDRIGAVIQANYQSWGMPFEEAKALVNQIDKTADEIELAAFGPGSLQKRQDETVTAAVKKASEKKAEVIQKDADEGYMKGFENPMAPVQVESDEPYMRAYSDDQSSAVHHGKSTTGRPLAP